MGTDSKENSLLEQPVAFVAAEDSQSPPENSHGESALLRLAELAEGFDAEQLAAEQSK